MLPRALAAACFASLREGACRDEHALRCALNLERAHESLNLGAPHRVLPALGLDVDLLQPESVERDDAVDATVAGSTHTLEVRTARAVPHGME